MRLVITTMRDEAPFVLEWIAYHRLIGFTDFLVFSNDCTDGTDALLDRLQALGVVTHVPNPRQGHKAVQWQALSRANDHPMLRRANWATVADVDEFLVIHQGEGRLDDLFAAVPQAQGFCVPWRMFGSSGQVAFRPDPVIGQFLRGAPDRMLWPLRATQFKTLFRVTDAVHKLGVHRPRGQDLVQGWVDGNGAPIQGDPRSFLITSHAKYGLAQINHYALGSAESFLVKAARGRPNRSGLAIDLGYWVERNLNAVEDRRILRHLDGVRVGMDALLADPEIARLHQAGIDARRARIAELLRDHDTFVFFSQLVQSPDTPVLSPETQMRLIHMRRFAQPSRDTASED